jgi:hypothetical protein
MVKYGVCLGAD